MRKLPIGIQTFKEVIEGGYLYVDKTKYLYEMIETGKYYFVSRPRRFGKSMAVTTLKELFRGNRELFRGLWIYERFEWKEHPVIHLDMSIVNHSEGKIQFKKSLSRILKEKGQEYGVHIKGNEPKDLLKELVLKLSAQNKVIMLVDEYDKPVVDYLENSEKAKENKEYLASFYEVIKGLDEYLRFAFLTGVTKFSKVSIFSKLNNLNDITMVGKYAGMFGITQDELEIVFEEEVMNAAQSMKIEAHAIKEQLQKWYNGYSWDALVKVYNPFSLLKFFHDKKLGNYWFETGTPTFLIEQIRKNEYDISEIEKVEVSEYVFDSCDMDNLDLTCLMFQSGYLTVKKINKEIDGSLSYSLAAPNFEVKQSIVNHVMGNYAAIEVGKIKPPYLAMLTQLKAGKIDDFVTKLKSILAAIPYNLYVNEERYYHSIFYLVMSLLGAKIDAEVLTDKGRIDGVIEFEDKVYVIELKLGDAKDAIAQIKDKKYYEKYLGTERKVYLLGTGGFAQKSIGYIAEEIGF